MLVPSLMLIWQLPTAQNCLTEAGMIKAHIMPIPSACWLEEEIHAALGEPRP